MTAEQRKVRRQEIKRRNYLKHRDAKLAYAAAYRAANAERIKAATAGKHASYSARYRERNPEQCRAMTQAWKNSNPEQRKSTQAAWLQANLDKHRTYQHNRRARKLAAGGTLSPDLYDRLFALQKGKCACCGIPLGGHYEIDHIVPLVLGGSNTDENIQLLTGRCNRQKGSRPPIEFMQARGRLI